MHSAGCRELQLGSISMPNVSIEWHHPLIDCGFRTYSTMGYLLWKWDRMGASDFICCLQTPLLCVFYMQLLQLILYSSPRVFLLNPRKITCYSTITSFLSNHPLLYRLSMISILHLSANLQKYSLSVWVRVQWRISWNADVTEYRAWQWSRWSMSAPFVLWQTTLLTSLVWQGPAACFYFFRFVLFCFYMAHLTSLQWLWPLLTFCSSALLNHQCRSSCHQNVCSESNVAALLHGHQSIC